MDDSMKQKIVSLLVAHRIMTIATLRPDGWPQRSVNVKPGLRSA